MKKIVIIGANEFQLPLIKKAKEIGLETHVFAWREGAVGADEASYFYEISIVEKEKILEICKNIKPDAAATIGSDLANITVGYLAENLGLPGNSMECVMKSTNKGLMRKAFQEAGIPTPYFRVVKNGENLSLKKEDYPVIVKPTDRSGSRAITKVERQEQLAGAIKNAVEQSFENCAIVETYLQGQEYSVECISYHGNHTCLTITKKFTTGAPHFIETGHIEPAPLTKEQKQKIEHMVFAGLDALKVQNGASHAEIRMDKEEKVHIIEIGSRMGGDCIGSHLVPLSTGCDFVKMVIETALGEKPEICADMQQKYAAIRFLMQQEDFQILEQIKREYPQMIQEIQIDGNPNEHPVVDSGSRYGYYIVKTETEKEMQEILGIMQPEEKKKLMILGASYSQLPLIKAAKRIGVYTITASTKGDWPGFQEADDYVYTDISNPEAVLQSAKEKQIDGIATCCLDTGVPAIGVTAESLGIMGPSAKAARIASNKYLMKEAFMRGEVSCARHIRIRNNKELEQALEKLKMPVIVKAVDLMGSRGMYRCDSEKDAKEAFEKTMKETKQEYCLVEEFIEGILFGAEAMIKNGEFLYCMIDNTEAYQSYVPTPIGHSVPFYLEKECGEEVRKQIKKAVKAVGLDNCPVNCDMMYKDGKVYVIEIAGRAGASCLPELIHFYYGIDYYEAIVRLALNLNVEEIFKDKSPKGAVLTHILISELSGKVKEIINENRDEADIQELSFNIKPGDYIHKYRNGRDRIGQVILTGKDLQTCEDRLQEVLEKIHIEFVE